MFTRFLKLVIYVIVVSLVTSFIIFPNSVSIAQSTQCNNVLRNAVITEYSSFYNDDFVPENLIDGNQNESWSSAEGDTQPYITFDFGGNFEIDRIQLNGYFQANDPAYQGDSVREFKLEVLVDTQWLTVIEAESPLQDRLIEYRFSTSVVTSQVKITFLSNHGGTSFEAAELEICGQRASVGSGGSSGGKEGGGKENPENEPLLSIQGNLTEGGEDSWDFEGSQNQVISVELQANTYNGLISLYDPDGDEISSDWADSNFIDNTYRASILGIQLLKNGTYSIRISRTLGPYTLTVTEGYFGETVGSLTIGEPTQGTVAENGFNRWLLDLSAGQIIGIELQANIYNSQLQLFDPDGDELESDWADSNFVDNTYRASILGVRILEDGLYMVRISNNIGAYTLLVTEGYFGQTVGTVAVGQSVQGTLDENGFNRWLITLSAGQTITIELQVATYNGYVQLFEPDGEEADTDWADSGQGNSYIGRISGYRVLTTGLYMIRVSSALGDYTLAVSGQ